MIVNRDTVDLPQGAESLVEGVRPFIVAAFNYPSGKYGIDFVDRFTGGIETLDDKILYELYSAWRGAYVMGFSTTAFFNPWETSLPNPLISPDCRLPFDTRLGFAIGMDQIVKREISFPRPVHYGETF